MNPPNSTQLASLIGNLTASDATSTTASLLAGLNAPTPTPTPAPNPSEEVAQEPVAEQAPQEETPVVDQSAPEETAQDTDAPAEQTTTLPDASGDPVVGTVDPAVSNAPAAVLTPSPDPAPVTAAPTPSSVPSNDQSIEGAVELSANCGAMGKIVYTRILEYMVDMKPRKPIDEASAGRNQVKLYNALLDLINKTEGDFTEVFTAVLKLFAIHGVEGKVFHEKYATRSMQSVNLNTDARRMFANLLNMFRLLADPAGRQVALKQISLPRTLVMPVTEVGRARVMNFFRVQ